MRGYANLAELTRDERSVRDLLNSPTVYPQNLSANAHRGVHVISTSFADGRGAYVIVRNSAGAHDRFGYAEGTINVMWADRSKIALSFPRLPGLVLHCEGICESDRFAGPDISDITAAMEAVELATASKRGTCESG